MISCRHSFVEFLCDECISNWDYLHRHLGPVRGGREGQGGSGLAAFTFDLTFSEVEHGSHYVIPATVVVGRSLYCSFQLLSVCNSISQQNLSLPPPGYVLKGKRGDSKEVTNH